MPVHTVNRNFLINTMAVLVQRIATLVLVAIYTRLMSPAEFGLYALILLFVITLSPLVISTVTGAIQRFYVEFAGAERAQCVGNVAIILFVAGTLAVVIVSLFGEAMISLVFSSPQVTYQPYFFLAQFAVFPFLFISIHAAVFQAEGSPGASVRIQSLIGVGLVTAGWYFVGLKGEGVAGAVKALLAGTWIVVPLIIWDLHSKLVLRPSRKFMKPVIAFSLPLVPYVALILAINSIDRIFLERLWGLQDVGLYAVALMLATVCGLVVSSYSNALSVSMFRTYKDVGEAMGGYALRQKVTAGFSLVLLAYVGLGLFAEEILLLLAGRQYAVAAPLVPIIAFGFVMRYIWLIFYYNLLYAKRTRVLPLVSLCGLTVTGVAAATLVPTLGGAGAAVAFVSGFAAMIAAGAWLTRLYKLPVCVAWRRILVSLAIAVAAVGMGAALPFDGWVAQSFFKVLIGVAVFWFLHVFAFLPSKELVCWVRQRKSKMSAVSTGRP